MAVEPDAAQIAELVEAAKGAGDGPVVMLNLNRYRDVADYDGVEEISGREAYGRYGEVALRTLPRLGARILWHAEAGQTVVGGEGDEYDEILAVWYPSRQAFLALATDPEVVAALPHRAAGLERAAIICCESGAEPVLAGIELPA